MPGFFKPKYTSSRLSLQLGSPGNNGTPTIVSANLTTSSQESRDLCYNNNPGNHGNHTPESSIYPNTTHSRDSRDVCFNNNDRFNTNFNSKAEEDKDGGSNTSVDDFIKTTAVKSKVEKQGGAADINQAVYMFPNGDKYEGDCIQTPNGSIERTGNGIHTSVTGIVYEGAWETDKMNGNGKLTHPSLACYEGDFVNNMFHGRGKYCWPNGSFYEGEFNENKMEGDGEYTDTEGQVWMGMFRYKSAPGLKFKLQMS